MYGLYKRFADLVLLLVKLLRTAFSDRSNAKPVEPPSPGFRCLEPRRVLSVNATFAVGILDITRKRGRWD